MREFYFSLGDDGAPDEKQWQLQRLSQLLAALGVNVAAEAAEREAANGAAHAGADGQQQSTKVAAKYTTSEQSQLLCTCSCWSV